MKKVLLFLVTSLFINVSFSQSNVYLKINHKLGSSAYAANATKTNNFGDKFYFDRVEYYISSIKITHDGGTETTVPNKWVLVNANATVNDSLGNFNITTIEKITFAIGIENAKNHLDPSTYSAGHPLAPKSPSMHWGWSSGYRFIALEGESGTASANQNLEIHGLEDANYFYLTITTAGTTSGSDKIIELDADYIQALKNINVSSGLVLHGSTGSSKTALDNFRDHVFTSTPEGNPSVGVEENTVQKTTFSIYPNPSTSNSTITFDVKSIQKNLTFQITDVTGKLIVNKVLNNLKQVKINTLKKGVYMVSLRNSKGILKTEKLVITQ